MPLYTYIELYLTFLTATMHTPFFEIITCTAHPRYQLCPPADSCFSDIALYNLNKRVGLLQSGHHHYFIESNSTSPLYSSNYTHLELNNNHALFCQLFLFDRGLLVVRVVVLATMTV